MARRTRRTETSGDPEASDPRLDPRRNEPPRRDGRYVLYWMTMFRRLGWTAERYQEWSDAQLVAGECFVTPTRWRGETVLRWCVVNPLTTEDDLAAIIASLADE